MVFYLSFYTLFDRRWVRVLQGVSSFLLASRATDFILISQISGTCHCCPSIVIKSLASLFLHSKVIPLLITAIVLYHT